ncbi:proprotein convertase subtilisin/kexin type 6-like [Nematolebias whitei]|uniref:proprotein convertase subtilisin/kexin type 6-like n=1 Tax=Nematolebias whitei TaxID=451745 RepID=UPI001898CA03|nr:proprotein convertase subtilisin/kexin type 6-like [Nematolebias whitei]
MFRLVLLWCCLLQSKHETTEGHRGTNRHLFYVVRMDGGTRAVKALAEQHGLEFIQRVGSLEGLYTLRDSRGRPDRATFEDGLVTAVGSEIDGALPVPPVLSSEPSQAGQVVIFPAPSSAGHHGRSSMLPARGSMRGRGSGGPRTHRLDYCNALLIGIPGKNIQKLQYVRNIAARVLMRMRSQRTESTADGPPEERRSDQPLTFNDPLWPMQWELFSQGERNPSGLDLNVMPVWRNNITGRGVVVSIIDDGVDYTNKDLKKNFEALASFDLRASHGLSHDPTPVRDENSHGTHCAGEVAMEANNSYCGVGIAFNARIGGIRLLDGNITDAMEATALTYNMHFIHIYVCSWGPRDNGAEMDGPHTLTAQALQLGAQKRGDVVVLMIEVGECTQQKHTAAANISRLTWRDVQHLIAKTAIIPNPEEPGWIINAAGYHVHHRYGFGLLDAALMVQQAALFHSVAPQRTCTQEVSFHSARFVPPGDQVRIMIQSEGCSGTSDEVTTLEHVQVRVSINAVCRGDLSISLESPGGTVSLLLDTRPNDASAAGLKNWTLMTVHCWGEQPRGLWILKVTDHMGTVRSCARPREEAAAGAVLGATLILYGTHHPNKPTVEMSLHSLVYMGSHHPIPHSGLDRRNASPPLDLLQWVYQMERDRKVQAADITLPAKAQV